VEQRCSVRLYFSLIVVFLPPLLVIASLWLARHDPRPVITGPSPVEPHRRSPGTASTARAEFGMTEHERRALSEIEQSMTADSPNLAQALRRMRPHPDHER
jgi:Protein of unknown function (DUF3040)